MSSTSSVARVEIIWFWAEKPFEFPISAEKSVTISDQPFESDSTAMKIRVKVAYSCLTLSKKRRPFPNPGYAPEFNPNPGHVVASLDNTLYDNYFCLVASNKQQIYVGRSQPESLEIS